MNREQVERTVAAENQVVEVTKVNDDMLARIKRDEEEHAKAIGVLEKLLEQREATVVQQEEQLEACEKLRAELVESGAALEKELEALKVQSGGELAALQARVDRKTGELERLQAALAEEQETSASLRVELLGEREQRCAATRAPVLTSPPAALQQLVVTRRSPPQTEPPVRTRRSQRRRRGASCRAAQLRAR